mmetsp:Transcript_3492/g.6719  ORF Transcript_3492/g.6719 Transcript_3492/m.6719 type:complete len:104 (-) Transcript_3492:1263-1574(-)
MFRSLFPDIKQVKVTANNIYNGRVIYVERECTQIIANNEGLRAGTAQRTSKRKADQRLRGFVKCFRYNRFHPGWFPKQGLRYARQFLRKSVGSPDYICLKKEY